MKPFGAVALLLTLTAITDCSGAERSRHRSGPIRSVPVAADIKRDVDFDCPEEFGYYPHPTDCALYYVCVFGGALLESCTGGLMYSHELQTCDWPRNVGCDATSAIGSDDLERLNDRAPPPPPPPRRTPPPPPPRAQPNPVVTSRGQPTRIKIEREPINEEYEKQQQLYAEVDDLPPVEELESDRQQRVYRGQPSTIGQVQKDRDGYVSQINSGRTINTNIIPASIPQSGGKIGSFSFGSQVDERRTSAVTESPQVYSEDKNSNVTDLLNDKSIDTKFTFDNNDLTLLSRRKRDLENSTSILSNNTNILVNKTLIPETNITMSKRNDKDEDIDYFEGFGEIGDDLEEAIDEADRGKRQIRFSAKNYKQFDKNWANTKPAKYIDLSQYNYNPNIHSARYQASDLGQNFYYSTQKPNNVFSTANPFIFYQENLQGNKPFKASLPDPYSVYNPINSATQIITKSPPISALKSEENPFASLAGGFYNNVPQQSKQSYKVPQNVFSNQQFTYQDSSHLPSTVVTGKPIQFSTVTNNNIIEKGIPQHDKELHNNFTPVRNSKKPQHYLTNDPNKDEADSYEDDFSSEEENSSATKNEDSGEHFKYDIPDLPYEYTHPSNKYANIENPFANPNFDFDDFLEKLRDDHYRAVGVTTRKPKAQNFSYKTINPQSEVSTKKYENDRDQKSKLNYSGMSTPRPFSFPTGQPVTEIYNNIKSAKYQNQQQASAQYQTDNQNTYIKGQTNAAISLENLRPKLKPANFKDDRDIPLTFNFNRPNKNQMQIYEQSNLHGQTQPFYSVTQKPYEIFFTSTRAPLILSTPKQQYVVKPEKLINLPGGKPYYVSTIKPLDDYRVFKQSTVSPYTTSNQQLASLQEYWRNHQTTPLGFNPTSRPSTVSELPKLEQLFSQTFRPTLSGKDQVSFSNNAKESVTSSTVKPTPKRRPIPKPSPEMNDYYYEDDEEPYHEPSVKSKYMPSSEVMPQRPPMSQNYEEYEEYYDEPVTPTPTIQYTREPSYPNSYRPNSITKNQNDFSAVTKAPFKDPLKSMISVPVMVDSVTLTANMRPEISNYEILHHHQRNKTHIRKPYDGGPNTSRPPKYLNQTTLRPYTIRHRLAKTTTVKTPASASEEQKQKRGRLRHQNLVAQIKATTAKDQDRRTKTRHGDKTNSLEPTESVTPSSYSASPRPKMLYNGSQSYNPDQFDPYYAVYDEDGELYKDTDYVQQYNTASIRPAVQQTYRGTPPPARRPVETISTRPVSSDDYDDALLQGQINNQNQYRPPVRQPARGEGNELGYEVPSSVRTPAYDVTPISTFPSTTSTTTTTPRPTSALFTEAMTPSRYTPRPTSTRGRGTAHYSTSGGAAESQPQHNTNRGTPPTRSRPTLKPSTSIVSKATEFVDIYSYPPNRPAPIYPTPTPDKTAAKCRKDVCLLPDCYCGGKDIPGDVPMEQVPQIVLLTFDDSVNDLNKGLYSDLFEKGRVNPNGCPISATFYVSHEWTDYSQVQNLYSAGHEMASHTVSHSFGEQFSQKKWNREVGGQREILAAYGGVKLEDVRGMRAPFLSVGGNKMFKMLYDSNFTYDSSLPVYENKPPSWPYTLDYKLFHDCMIPPCPTKSYPGVWEVPMVMWQDLNGGRCSMGDACANPSDPEGVYKMILKNFDRHYTTNRAPFGLFYHAAWFTQPHHKEGFIMFLDFINRMNDVWIVTNWQALQWVRDPTPINRLNNFQPFQCNYQDRPRKCNNPKVCNLWHKSGVRYMRTCQPCPEIYPWTGKTGIRSSRIDHDNEE